MSAVVAAPAAAQEQFEPKLPIDRIELSKTNPRKHITPASIDELAESIKQHGIASPVLVRPHPKKEPGFYELVFGERRYRAAQKLGLKTVPAMIRDLDDKAVVELQIIENLQRENVHELDEANGYRELIDHHDYTPASLAEKIGMSEKYIYDRMKLAALCPELQKLFYARELTAGHAILLARLPGPSQLTLIKDGLYETVREGNQKEDVVVSVRELGRIIKEKVHRDLKKAIFDRKDASLLPKAGACQVCPKRTGATCLDPGCFSQKFNELVKQKVDAGQWVAASQDYNKKGTVYWWDLVEAREKSCTDVKTAILVDGWNRGERRQACTNAECKVHRRAASRSYNYAAANKKQQRERRQKCEIERAYRMALYQQLDKQIDRYIASVKSNPLPIAKVPLAIIAAQLLNHIDYQLEQEVLKELGIKTKGTDVERERQVLTHMQTLQEKQLAAFVMKTALRNEVFEIKEYSKDITAGADGLHAAATFYKIDAEQLRKQVLAKLEKTPAKKDILRKRDRR